MTSVLPRTRFEGAAPAYVPWHHPSHGGLLYRPLRPTVHADVDAIVVPTIRHITVLREALSLGRKLDCPVVALCSSYSKSQDAQALADQLDAKLIAVKVYRELTTLPTPTTSTLLSYMWVREDSDLSVKRNIALALARMAGWQRIVFLDDDISDIDPGDVGAAAALLQSHPIVALENVGYPDNSVVCHALRKVGITQDSFVGGGAMAVAADRIDSFFPDIYNEDWFFMLGVLGRQGRPNRVAAIGKATQKSYDPFLRPSRARVEELGDCLAEGVYSLLDDGMPLEMAMEASFWKAFLADRGKLLDRIVTATLDKRLAREKREKMINSLKAAQGRHRLITTKLCVSYMRAWKADLDLWRNYLSELPKGCTPVTALEHLRLRPRVSRAYWRATN